MGGAIDRRTDRAAVPGIQWVTPKPAVGGAAPNALPGDAVQQGHLLGMQVHQVQVDFHDTLVPNVPAGMLKGLVPALPIFCSRNLILMRIRAGTGHGLHEYAAAWPGKAQGEMIPAEKTPGPHMNPVVSASAELKPVAQNEDVQQGGGDGGLGSQASSPGGQPVVLNLGKEDGAVGGK